ncbi:hypothetical protein [Roseobacter litoralis]|uniref:Uncharacterized protein n=1 Tax=Roseobacter litoralis (strain ATCC 49566 / DSM 6996 / JCM 21268 / NBRC 15278 / OCh 149) TaxID=391595 RepID=F7ZE40_ROSLO|nr:hypothetical protein [Roseobacter litoralis]AEI93361.1 hypothetical protein RLO149_c013600 [Roseobacter litoralis Och 149]
MTHQDKNLTRALAILATHPDQDDFTCRGNIISVRGQRLNLTLDDDRAVLEILMTNAEFGYAVTYWEMAAKELRNMQNAWSEEELAKSAA